MRGPPGSGLAAFQSELLSRVRGVTRTDIQCCLTTHLSWDRGRCPATGPVSPATRRR